MRALRQLLYRLSGMLIGLVDHGCVPARIAIFWPDLVPIPVQGDHYDFHWEWRLRRQGAELPDGGHSWRCSGT